MNKNVIVKQATASTNEICPSYFLKKSCYKRFTKEAMTDRQLFSYNTLFIAFYQQKLNKTKMFNL